MTRSKELWVHTTANGQTPVTTEVAEEGLAAIRDALSYGKWEDPTPTEKNRAMASASDIRDNLGSHPKVLRITSNAPQLYEKVQSALLLTGVLNRRHGIYNGAVLPPPGPCAVIANEVGRQQLESFLNQRIRAPASPAARR